MFDLGNPATWVSIFLFIFLGILYWANVPGLIAGALDKRSKEIRNELDEARKLREEAQSLLADYQRKAREAEQEAEGIIAQAQREAEIYAAETREKLKETLERRTKAADLKIAQAETQAINEVRQAAVEAATKAAEKILASKAQGEKANDLITASIDEVKSRMN